MIRNSRDQGDSALLIFDLDRLKAINDSFGHSMGDRALTTFGEVAAKSIRNEDFLARIGGDEFALLLTRVDSVRAVRGGRAHSFRLWRRGGGARRRTSHPSASASRFPARRRAISPR